MSRVYNFSAGPAVLPEEVLKEAQEEMLDYRGCGQSVMEMSHRSRVFDDLINETEADLRDLMQIPDNYRILYMQGGASLQFAMIPMNLMKNGVADYYYYGAVGKESMAGSTEVRPGECHCVQCGQNVFVYPGLQRSADRCPDSRLRLYLRE